MKQILMSIILGLMVFPTIGYTQEPNMDLAPEVVGGEPMPEPVIETLDQLSAQLSFQLTDLKLRAFAQAASTIQQINARWDAMIAGTAKDEEAVKLNQLSQDEIEKFFQMLDGLTIQEYYEIFQAATTDKKLNQVTQAYINVFNQDRLDSAVKDVEENTLDTSISKSE